MKLFLLSVFCFFYCGLQAQQHTIYYTAMKIPVQYKNTYWRVFDTKLLAEDLATLLKQATGKTYNTKPYHKKACKGIFLLLDTSKRNLTNEQGILESNGKDLVTIRARFVTGLSYTLYSWLDEMGFKFYLPGDKWVISPLIKDVFNKKISPEIYRPYFKHRMFGGSGAVVNIKGLDENREVETDWLVWNRRNRMGSEYMYIEGHAGEEFNIAHKAEIEKDPAILAPTDGKRQFKVFGKLDPTNKKGVALFSDWLIKKAAFHNKAEHPFFPVQKYISADAGDGLNYCYTPDCLRQYKSISDQAFSIVNETARKMKEQFPQTGISTYAYTERADTPSFKIDPNVHVQVISSAFQTVNTKAGLVKSWAAKTANISLYDYLNIAVWSADQPHFNLGEYYHYLQFIRSLNVKGINFESSRSKFSSGILQYFILNYLCDPYLSIDDKLEEFCNKSFGNAAVFIKEIFREWYFSNVHLLTIYDYPTFYADELGRFIKQIKAAENTKGLSRAELDRIDELKIYIVYLCKMYELRNEPEHQQLVYLNPGLKNAKENEILRYSWSFYKTGIFHNTQLTDLFLRNGHKSSDWDYQSGNYAEFKNVKTGSMLATAFNKAAVKYLPKAYPLFEINENFLLANAKYSAESFKISSMDELSTTNFIYPFEFYCAAPCVLKIDYKSGTPQNPARQNRRTALLAVEKNDYSYIKSYEVVSSNSKGSVSFQIPAQGKYKLYLSQYGATHVDYIIYPSHTLFYHNKKSILMNMMQMQELADKDYYSNKNIAIYTGNTDTLRFHYLYWDCSNTLSFSNAKGAPLPVLPVSLPTDDKKVPLGSAEQNTFIFYSNIQYRWPPVIQNVPPYYFFLKYPLKQ